MAEYREALRIMRAIDAFDAWLCQAPAERVRAAVAAALSPALERLSTLLDLPIVKSSLTFCSFAPSVSRTSEAVGWP
jgi:hypothetical protein